MPTNYIVLAIPVFFALIILELGVALYTRRPLYRLSDTIANMSTGVIDQVLGTVFSVLITLTVYQLVHEKAALWNLESSSWLTWAFAFIGVDFFYYWWHRLSHEVNFLWAAHVVHHHSQEYNLSVALRQTYLTSVFSVPFYLPLAVLGVDPLVFAATKSFMILYQFWIHTRVIPKLGPAELILNTPSHHRVHHGINPQYVDKNYAGTFIVWDRLFGTFEEEREEVVYGTLKPLGTWNPLWSNIDGWIGIFKGSLSARGLRNKLGYWLRHPGWAPGTADIDFKELFEKARGQRFDVPLSRGRSFYVLVQFLLLLAASAVLLNAYEQLHSTAWLLTLSAYLIFGLYSVSTIAERKPYGTWLELGRLAVGAVATPFALGWI